MKTLYKYFRLVFLIPFVIILICCSSGQNEIGSSGMTDLNIINNLSSALSVGFAATKITPEVPDSWIDINKDAVFQPGKGDTYTDGNGNGVFDPVWIAGFGNRRPANGIHDDLWARTMIIDDGKTRLAIVSVDVIGFMNNCVNDVRDLIPADDSITYLIISSTHTHGGPDLLGLWGKGPTKSGVNKVYLESVKLQIVKSVESAVSNLRPAYLTVSEDLTGAIPLVRDSRKPEVFDHGLRIIRAVDKQEGNTLGTLISWGNHPETLWGKNLLITSDFAHYLREGVEKGVFNGDSLIIPGTGGIAVYITGAIGGLMTTPPSLAITDPFSGEEFLEPSFKKAKAQGTHLAILVLNAISNPAENIDSASISLIARSLSLPLKNKLFKLGKLLGVLDRGTSDMKNLWTEMAVFKIGPLSFATIPGEVYPEIINGGVEAPEGNDFSIEPVEVPAIRTVMPGKYKFVFGLANDEIGYIIPKSQWDARSPFTYGSNKSPYGEENSPGPETAPILHKTLIEMLSELENGSGKITD